MALTTPKSPNLRETDTANARYTDLNRFHKNVAKALAGADNFINNGLLQLPNSESNLRVGVIEDGSQAKIGDTVLIGGNRIGRIEAISFDGGGTEALLDITVIEEFAVRPLDLAGGALSDHNFINDSVRRVDHIIGLQTDSAEVARLSGDTQAGLTQQGELIYAMKSADPATWGAVAQAARKYQGLGLVTVTFDAFTDGGVTDYATSNLNIYPVDQDQDADALIQITTNVTGDATAQLQEGVSYIVRDGSGALAQVQPHPGSASVFTVPTDDTPLTVVIHNAAAV